MALQLGDLGGEKGASRCRSIAFSLEGGDCLSRLGCKVVTAGFDGGDGARFQILDPGARCFQPPAFLVLLCDGDRQRLFGSVERPGGITHLLVEDYEGMLIGDFLGDRDGPPANQGDQGLEHLASAMNIVHREI